MILSRIFFNYLNFFKNINLSKFDFHVLLDNEFKKELNCKSFFLKNSLLYYDYFFLTSFLFFSKRTFMFLNFNFFKNFKNFINYLYNLIFLKNNFLVLDNILESTSLFINLYLPESSLIVYNYFFNRNSKFVEIAWNVINLKYYFEKDKISLLILINYEIFYKYLPLFSIFNLTIFSFVFPNMKAYYLDFFLFKSKPFFILEKIIFLSKIYHIYTLAYRYMQYSNCYKYVLLHNKFSKYIL